MNSSKTGKYNVAFIIVICLVFCYGFIYPVILSLFFYPNPNGVDIKQKTLLKSLFITISIYADNNNDSMPPKMEKLKTFYPEFPYNEFKLSCLPKLPPENITPPLLVAYSSKPSPRAPSPREYLCFFKLRLWPTETVKERRYTIFSNGKIEIIEEAVFKNFLEEQTKIIESTKSIKTKL